MNWQESCHHYPHQWLLIEAVQAHTDADQRIIDNLAVIGADPDAAAALRDYARLHPTAPDRELYVAHTDRPALDITERQSTRVRRKPDPHGILATPPRLGDLAVNLFGTVAGIDLDLPRHPPHEPLAFEL